MKKSLFLLSIALLAILTLVSAYTVLAEKLYKPPIEVLEVRGSQIWVPQYSKVDVYVTVYNPGGTTVSGTLKVEVRKDLMYLPDETYAWLFEDITLNPHESKEFHVGDFMANDLTNENNFREYFVKVYFNDECIYDPTDPDTREWVKTYKK